MDKEAELAREFLSYNPSTGRFVWIKKLSRKTVVGEQAGALRPDGYVSVQVAGKRFMAHRLAWFFMFNEWPTEIDHRNRNRSDNRRKNLRDGTSSLNKENIITARAHNKNSGLLGVYLDKRKIRNPWRAAIVVNKKRIHIGVFPTKEEAHAAYLKVKKKMHKFSQMAELASA